MLAVVALFAATPAAGAAGSTYHVDPGGSDDDPGTASKPWKTLQHAADHVGPGDTIVVHPGTYAGMRIETPGAPGNWITVTAAEPNSVTIDRPGPDNVHDSNVELERWEGGPIAYWVVEGLEVRDAPSWGIDVRGSSSAHAHHIKIRRNHVHHNGVKAAKTGIFFGFADDVWVVQNNSHHNGEHGVYLSNSGDGFTVKENRLHDNERCGLHMNGDISQGGDGVISDGTIEGNWIEGNGAEGCAGINMDGVTDARIVNNVIVENHATGIAIFQQDGGVCSRRIEIANNTIVQAADGRWGITVGSGGCRDLTFTNNVILTRHPWRGSIELPSASVPGLESDHNVIADRFSIDDGNSSITLAQWRAATGGDAHSAVGTIGGTLVPDSYRPVLGGPAYEAGVSSPADRDHDRLSRPLGGTWEIGAFETPLCGGQPATIVGTRFADDLTGTSGADVIAGLFGVDTIRGGGGDDLICGGGGGDDIAGNTGDDDLRGNTGGDTLRGHAGNDRLFGAKQADQLYGGAGTDHLDGGPATDTCTGGETYTACE
jgi:parallel beta-helix repeat protein